MSVIFFEPRCQTYSIRQIFGLCDDSPPSNKPAYIDEENGANWIATVDNYYKEAVTFTSIDHCTTFPPKRDGKTYKRCDGVLTYLNTIAFVELKQRNVAGTNWIKEAEEQLRISISIFEDTAEAKQFAVKRAYIVNSERPKFREGQSMRMEKFVDETTYVLRIEARIKLY